MKKILAAVALASASFVVSAAGVVGVVQNESGGRIELTDIPCRPEVDKPGMIAKAWGKGNDIYGCWVFAGVNGDTIMIQWMTSGTGSAKTYPTELFKLTPYGEKNYGAEEPTKAPVKPALKNEKQV